MLVLFSIYFNLLLSYVSGIVPFGYNFRTGRFESRKSVACLASVLLLTWLIVSYQYNKLSNESSFKLPRVGMQSTIHSLEWIVLNANWLLIGVQQLLHLENYRQRLTDLLTSARSWEGRQLVGRVENFTLLLKLVLLPRRRGGDAGAFAPAEPHPSPQVSDSGRFRLDLVSRFKTNSSPGRSVMDVWRKSCLVNL
ncbi:AGAP002635-PB-like protein [Anopheles sinensis]|uniref:AGAP002635-PB-like protein n=1 Tax=Anopheles sinensis TaxID=74873 RepID=A0A084WUT6_ANOSI|nr:AGAP002635-PB-like protein [Anopheles sinensis]